MILCSIWLATALGTKTDMDTLRKKNRTSNWKFQGEQGSFSASSTWQFMVSQVMWSLNVDRGLIEDLFLGAFTGCWKQRSFSFFLFLCKDVKILQGDSTDVYNALILFFKRNYVCVCVCWQLSRRKYSHSFSLPSALLPVPHPCPSGMREGKTEWDLEFSCWERDILCNQVNVQRTNALRKLSKGERQFRVIQLFSNAVWAAADLCKGQQDVASQGDRIRSN